MSLALISCSCEARVKTRGEGGGYVHCSIMTATVVFGKDVTETKVTRHCRHWTNCL